MKLIDQGRTAEIYEIDDNRIIKLFRKNFPLRAIENEELIAATFHCNGMSVPCYYGKTMIDGRYGLKYEYIRGISMMKLFISKPSSFFSSAMQMAELHAEIHKKSIKGIPALHEELKFFIDHTKELDNSEKMIINQKLSELEKGDCLCHGDMHPDNILLSDKGPVVIDWMTATSGNPAGDVAKTIIILKYSKVQNQVPFLGRVFTNIVKKAFCKKYLKHYICLTGMDINEINKWKLPVAAARIFENGLKLEKKALLKYIKKELKKLKVM